MAEQLPQRDLVAARNAREIFGDLVVEIEPPLIFEQQERHRRELLGIGSDLIGQVGAGGGNGFRRLAVGLGEDDLTAANNCDRGGWGLCLFKRLHDELVDPRLLIE